jgi:hypothetical protein
LQKNHNKEALLILDAKKSQMILDKQSLTSGYIPTHSFKANFLDYYAEFVKNHDPRAQFFNWSLMSNGAWD